MWDFLLNISTLNYWVIHKGAWYVALLLPLYFITPFIGKLIDSINKKLRFSFVVLFCIIIFVITENLHPNFSNDLLKDLWHNFTMAFSRTPIYFIGYALAPLISKGVKISYLWCFIFPIVQVCFSNILYIEERQRYWLVAFFILMIFCFIISHINKLNDVFKYMGIISLESYLANVFVSYFLKEIQMITSGKGLFIGNYFYYILVILLGMLLAILTNKITNYILRK